SRYGSRCTCRGSAPSRSGRGSSCDGLPVRAIDGIGVVEPVDLVELADDDELVAVGANRAVIVEAIGELGVAADHVSWLQERAGHRIMDAAAEARDPRARHVHDLLLRMVHEAHAFMDPLAHDRASGDGPVQVEELDPVVVYNTG